MTNPGVTNGQPDSRIDEPDGTRGWLIEGTFVPQGDPDRYPGDYGAITEIAAPFVEGFVELCKARDWQITGLWTIHGGFDSYIVIIEHYDMPKARKGRPYPEVVLEVTIGHVGQTQVRVEVSDTPRMFVAPCQLVEVQNS